MQTQTAANTRQFGIGPVKNIALALGIAATVAVGAAAVAVTRNDDTAAVSQLARSVAAPSHAYNNWRFLEINEMPAAAAAATLSAAELRFLEINTLPEASVVAPVLYDTMRFLEINEMAVAPLVTNTVDMRFWEINQLPGDNVQNLSPSADRRGERH